MAEDEATSSVLSTEATFSGVVAPSSPQLAPPPGSRAELELEIFALEKESKAVERRIRDLEKTTAQREQNRERFLGGGLLSSLRVGLGRGEPASRPRDRGLVPRRGRGDQENDQESGDKEERRKRPLKRSYPESEKDDKDRSKRRTLTVTGKRGNTLVVKSGGTEGTENGLEDKETDDEPHKIASAVVVAQPETEGEVVPTGKSTSSPSSKRGVKRVERRGDLSKDKQLKSRNKRMFGLLLGHLAKAQTTLKKEVNTPAMKNKTQTETRVMGRLEEERAALRKKYLEKFKDKKEKELVLRDELSRKQSLKKLQLLEIILSEHHETLNGFILTQSEPRIYYLPAQHNETTEKLLADQKLISQARAAKGNFLVRDAEEDKALLPPPNSEEKTESGEYSLEHDSQEASQGPDIPNSVGDPASSTSSLLSGSEILDRMAAGQSTSAQQPGPLIPIPGEETTNQIQSQAAPTQVLTGQHEGEEGVDTDALALAAAASEY